MRSRSVIGPLLLIGLGAVLLANTLKPDMSLMRLLAKGWPYLLIGWGALRLIEILLWAARSRPLPATGLSGGEWSAAILIALIGSGTFLVQRHAPWERLGRISVRGVEVFGRPYDYGVEEKSVAVGKAPRILVENLHGDVRVVGVEGEQLIVRGHKTIRALNEGSASQAHKQTEVEVSVQGDQVVVRSNQERVSGEHRISIDLDLTVPKGSSIHSRSARRGSYDITDIAGDVDLNSDEAEVRLSSIGGKVRLDLRGSDLIRASGVKGNLEVQGRGSEVELESIEGETSINGSYSGELRFRNLAKPLHFQSSRTDLRVERIPGHLTLDLGSLQAADVVGPIRIRCSSKDVELDTFSGPLDMELERGDVELRPVKVPLSPVKVSTDSGDIRVGIPEKASFALDARTDRGEVANDYGPSVAVDSREHGGTMKTATTEGPLLTLSSRRGSITIHRDTAIYGEHPPEPPQHPTPPEKPRGRRVETETY